MKFIHYYFKLRFTKFILVLCNRSSYYGSVRHLAQTVEEKYSTDSVLLLCYWIHSWFAFYYEGKIYPQMKLNPFKNSIYREAYMYLNCLNIMQQALFLSLPRGFVNSLPFLAFWESMICGSSLKKCWDFVLFLTWSSWTNSWFLFY